MSGWSHCFLGIFTSTKRVNLCSRIQPGASGIQNLGPFNLEFGTLPLGHHTVGLEWSAFENNNKNETKAVYSLDIVMNKSENPTPIF